MAPCSFDKMEKKVNDLLFKDFAINHVKFETKKKELSNYNIKLFADSHGIGTHAAKVQVSNFLPKYDIEFTNSLTTGNLFTQEIKYMPRTMKGLELKGIFNFPATNASQISGLLSARYSHCHVNSSLQMNVGNAKEHQSIRLIPSFVFSKQGFSLGGTMKYSPSENALLSYDAIAAYDAPNFSVTLNYNKNLGATFYQRLNRDAVVGVSANLTNRTFVVGGSYDVSPTLNLKANLGSKNCLRTVWTHKYSDFLTVKLSSAYNLSDTNSSPSFGLGLVYEA